jgi:2-methylcitrate dehydratase PrpD
VTSAPTEGICAFVSGFQLSTVSVEIVERAKSLILDTLAVAVAATGSAVTPVLHGLIAGAFSPGGSTVIGWKNTVGAGQAAFANAAMAHALEYDDSTLAPIGHPSCVIVPSALALAEQERSSGADFLAAYLAGLEVHSRLGQGEAGGWRSEGYWLPIGHVSLIGAAAACARLLGLDLPRIANALGLATQFCGCLSVSGGTMAKPLGAGAAARSGLEAAVLAAAEATGPASIIERPAGFADIYLGSGHDLVTPLSRLGSPLHLDEVGVAIKRYPSVYATHWGIDALLLLLSEHALAADNVETIVLTHPQAAAFCDNPSPRDETAARFSHEYNLAVALLDGVPSPHSYRGERLASPELQSVLERVTAGPHPPGTPSPQNREYLVTVRTRSGQTWSKSVLRPLGHPKNPMTPSDLEEKFWRCVDGVLPEAHALALLDSVRHLEELKNLKGLAAVLSQAGWR